MDFLQFFNFICAIIIDNDYSRHNFTRITKKKRNGGEGSVYLFLFVPIFEVEFIARYIY